MRRVFRTRRLAREAGSHSFRNGVSSAPRWSSAFRRILVFARWLASVENVGDAESLLGVARVIEPGLHSKGGSSNSRIKGIAMAPINEVEELRAAGRLRRRRSIALAMLVITGVINYVDRSTLSIAEQPIREELGLSNTEMGFLLSAFSWSYAFAQLPTGALVDKVGPRILLAAGLALWSVAQACGGLVTSLRQFVATRIALGIGEAPQFPTGVRVVSDWYHIRERGLPTGVFNSSSSLGPALAPPLLTALMAAFGWRRMFFIMGAVGLLAASVVVHFLSRSAARRAVRGRTPVVARRRTADEWRYRAGAVAAPVPPPDDLGDGRRLRRRPLPHLALSDVAAGLFAGPTPYDHTSGRIRGLGSLSLRLSGIAGRRCRLGSACGPGHFADQ